MMPSSASTFATAPSSESVLRVPSESSSFASRQSGLMAEKICLCLTCPAITARVTPAALKVSMSFDSSPSESQCTEAAPRDFDLREGLFFDGGDDDVISLRPRRVQHEEGKLAIAGDKPETRHCKNHVGTAALGCPAARSAELRCERTAEFRSPDSRGGCPYASCPLLNHSPLRSLNKPNQHLHIFPAIRFRLQLLQRLRSIQLRRQQHPIRMMNFLDPLLRKSPPLQPHRIQSISLRAALGRSLRKWQHIARDGACPRQ